MVAIIPALLASLTSIASGSSDEHYQAELAAWRESRAASLTRDDGWTALVGLHWLDPAQPMSMGSRADNQIVIDGLPERLGHFRFHEGVWSFVVESAGSVRVRGETRAIDQLDIPMLSDRQAAAQAATPTRLQSGPVHWALIERGQQTGVRIWNADAPTRLGFKGLSWFDPDTSWRVTGQWIEHDPPRIIEVATVLNTLEPMRNPGAVRFERDGRTFVLEALAEEGDTQLFFIFADRSNRSETYGAGRYLYTDGPPLNGDVILDFNRAFNPPCAYTAFATCPLPPPENRLDARVDSGEMRY